MIKFLPYSGGLGIAHANYGLSFRAVVTTYTDTTHFVASGIAGKGNDFFNSFYAYVVRDAGGAGAAPQGEARAISDYVSATGTFTHTAFSTPVAVGDELFLLHPYIWYLLELAAANVPADIDTLLARLTAARAGYLDELAAANLPADVDTLLARLTALRAGYLDELDFDLSARLGAPAGASLAADLLVIDNFVDDLEAAVGAIEGVTTLHNKLTAARAALLDQITAVRLAELDAANIPADIDTIKALVDSAETTGPYSYTDAGGEQDVIEDTAVTRRRIFIEFSNRNMTQTGTFRLYRKPDGTTYDLYISQPVLVVAGSERAFDAEFTTNQAWKLTYQEDADETAARAIPFNTITQGVE